MNQKVRIANIIFNSLLVTFVTISLILMVTSSDTILTSGNASALRFFTVDSNVMCGIGAIISLIYLIINKNYHKWVVLFKLAATVSLFLTFMVVLFYLVPMFGFSTQYSDANAFMHLLTPLLAMVQFILIEPKKDIKFLENIYGVIPMFVYGIFYITNVAIHDGYGTFDYDWYYFGTYGLGIGIIIFIIILVITFGFALALSYPYKKIDLFKNKEK